MKALGLAFFFLRTFLCFSHDARIYKGDLYTELQIEKLYGSYIATNRKALWELSVAMETRVLFQPGPKPNATFPHPQ